MIRTNVTSLKTGMKIAKAVFNDEGELLLGRGMVLNEFLIRGLGKKGVVSVFIYDDETEDILPDEPVSDIVRGSTIRELKNIIVSLDTVKQEMKRFSVMSAADSIGSSRFKDVFGANPALKNIRESAHTIVDELLNEEISLGLNSIKTFDNYLFEHSIDVAIFAIVLGRKLDLPRRRLRELGMGCLLHDIGMTFIPSSIVQKKGKLTREEFEQVKFHPEIGYELTKDVAQIGVLPPHVAFQHHEHQDGEGYPRGMTGNPRIEIGDKPRQLHLYASICAIADVYDALVSDRPFRQAYPTEKALGIMVGMAGTHLHERLLNEFMAFAPPFPVGSTVRVVDGEYKGYIGLVRGLSSEDIKRPIVRLVLNTERKRISPVEISLYDRKNVTIESISL